MDSFTLTLLLINYLFTRKVISYVSKHPSKFILLPYFENVDLQSNNFSASSQNKTSLYNCI